MLQTVMATIDLTIVPVVQCRKYLNGILHVDSRLFMNIPRTHECLLLTDIGNTVTEYRKRYNMEKCKEMFSISAEEVDTPIGTKLPDAV